MSTNHKRYMREYMRRKRAKGFFTRWRTAKKEKSVLYRIFRKQKYGVSTFKTLSIGIALGPIYLKAGYTPNLNKDNSKSKWVLLNSTNFSH